MQRGYATAALLMLTIAAVGCGNRQAESDATGQAATYRVRGVVRSVGDGSLHIRHEAIPEFRDPSGDVVGMEAMSMEFALDAGVSTDGLSPGDTVAFDLSVDWDAPQPAAITALEALPADTELGFGDG